jgi:hypothetical protein
VSLRNLLSADSRVRVLAALAVGVGVALGGLTRGRQVLYQRRPGRRGDGWRVWLGLR